MKHATPMVVSVIPNAVSALLYHLKNFRVLARILTYHKEGGFHSIFIKHIKHPRRYLGDGAVVKSKVDGFLCLIHAPQGTRIKPTHEAGGLFDKHGSVSGMFLLLEGIVTVVLWELQLLSP